MIWRRGSEGSGGRRARLAWRGGGRRGESAGPDVFEQGDEIAGCRLQGENPFAGFGDGGDAGLLFHRLGEKDERGRGGCR